MTPEARIAPEQRPCEDCQHARDKHFEDGVCEHPVYYSRFPESGTEACGCQTFNPGQRCKHGSVQVEGGYCDDLAKVQRIAWEAAKAGWTNAVGELFRGYTTREHDAEKFATAFVSARWPEGEAFSHAILKETAIQAAMDADAAARPAGEATESALLDEPSIASVAGILKGYEQAPCGREGCVAEADALRATVSRLQAENERLTREVVALRLQRDAEWDRARNKRGASGEGRTTE